MSFPLPRSLLVALVTLLGLGLLAPVAALGGAHAGSSGEQDTGADFDATIRRTAHGIPHILADDYGGLGFGYGHAFAEDNICTAADFYVTVNGERSKYFGPDASWAFRGNGTTNNNLASDAFYTATNESGRIEELLSQEPPHGPSDELRETVRGYVAGYNAYLESVGGTDGIDDPRCAGEPWVRPIEEIDAYRRFYQLASLASTGVAIDGIGGHEPPTPDHGLLDGGDDGAAADELDAAGLAELLTGAGDAAASLPDIPGLDDDRRELIERLPHRFSEELGIGSNAYGLGNEVTADETGMVLGNPHFPWTGGERLYQAHLTIPGELDVQGSSLLGVPIILIGTTEGMAWSHTVSTAFRFTPFELKLVPGSPTTYLVDGQPREMEAREVTVEVPGEDDATEEVERTVYWTEYGPVITEILGLPLFPWTPETAYAMGDANDHMRYLNHFFEKNHAQSVDELFDVTVRNQGVPWVNTIAADAEGNAYYSDVSVVPNVPDSKVVACPTSLGVGTFLALGLPVLDGSRSSCGWDSDDDAVADGIFGPDNLPHLIRDDYVHNGNDSYWLSNPREPLTGYDRIIGDEETARSIRTRIGLVMIEDRLAGDDLHTDLHPDRWTKETLKAAMFDNRQHAGELMVDELIEHCERLPGTILSSSGPVSTEGACEALAGWDVRDELDSTGALLFRRFVTNLAGMTSPVGDPTGTGALGLPWLVPFDPDDPVHTPNTLNTNDPRVTQAFADGIDDLETAEIALDARLGDHQFARRGEWIPMHGGPGGLGVFNAMNYTWQGTPGERSGYTRLSHGSSFIMAATWSDEEGECPVQADALVTYGQSENPRSDYFNDQTWLTSEKSWVPMRFCEDDILADPELQVREVSSGPDTTNPDRPGRPDEPGRPGQPGKPEHPGRPHAAGEQRQPAGDAGSAGGDGDHRASEGMAPAAALAPVPGGSAWMLAPLLGVGLAVAVRRRA